MENGIYINSSSNGIYDYSTKPWEYTDTWPYTDTSDPWTTPNTPWTYPDTTPPWTIPNTSPLPCPPITVPNLDVQPLTDLMVKIGQMTDEELKELFDNNEMLKELAKMVKEKLARATAIDTSDIVI